MTARRAIRTVATMVVFQFLMATASGAETPSAWHLTTSLGAGAMSPDPSLADYRWDTTPTALFGLQATVGRGRLAAGLRLSRWGTTQGTGLALDEADPQVQLTQLGFIGQFRLVQVSGFQLWGSGLIGQVNMSYTPDRVIVDTGNPGGDLEVDYDPITEMDLGLGLEVRRDFGKSMAASLLAERSSFQLETSHRRGAEIVTQRETFINWSVRLQLAWVLDLG